MELTLGKKMGGQGESADRGIQEMLLRMAIGMAINFIGRQIKKKREFRNERKKAERKVAKLQRKGREVPGELSEKATAGLSRREKKKLARKAGKKKKRGRKVLFLLMVVAGIVVAVKVAGSK
jgi:cytochrome c-type biogenesis protein CcmH/NrfG